MLCVHYNYVMNIHTQIHISPHQLLINNTKNFSASDFIRWLIKAMREFVFILLPQYTILFPQLITLFPQHIILFPQYIILFPQHITLFPQHITFFSETRGPIRTKLDHHSPWAAPFKKCVQQVHIASMMSSSREHTLTLDPMGNTFKDILFGNYLVNWKYTWSQ